MTNRTRASIISLALCSCALLVGCKSDPQREQLSAVRSDPAPEMATLSQRPDDVDNKLAHVDDTNLRACLGDLGRVFYTNRASRLTPEPMR